MIQNRPENLLALPFYRAGEHASLGVDWASVPDLLKLDIAALSGIQPITGELMKAAGGIMHDSPSEAEIERHIANGSRFQMVQIVASLFNARPHQGGLIARPYALSLVPAMKRGLVQETSIDFIRRLDLNANPLQGMAYLGFDPFTLDRGIWGPLPLFAERGALRTAFIDEVGVVSDGYFLMRPFEPADVLIMGTGIKNADAAARYAKHRLRTYYKWFENPRPRRIWGLESPVELFLAQAMAARGMHPELQALILDDGSIYPSLYHLITDDAFKANPAVVTTADFFFPEARLAVFYDSNNHHRRKMTQEKDERITQRLTALGIDVLRIRARDLAKGLDNIVDAVAARLLVTAR